MRSSGRLRVWTSGARTRISAVLTVRAGSELLFAPQSPQEAHFWRPPHQKAWFRLCEDIPRLLSASMARARQSCFCEYRHARRTAKRTATSSFASPTATKTASPASESSSHWALSSTSPQTNWSAWLLSCGAKPACLRDDPLAYEGPSPHDGSRVVVCFSEPRRLEQEQIRQRRLNRAQASLEALKRRVAQGRLRDARKIAAAAGLWSCWATSTPSRSAWAPSRCSPSPSPPPRPTTCCRPSSLPHCPACCLPSAAHE